MNLGDKSVNWLVRPHHCELVLPWLQFHAVMHNIRNAAAQYKSLL